MRLWDYLKHWPGAPGYLFCAAVLAAVLRGYLLGSGWLAAALLLYCALLWRWPAPWLLLVPAALPVLDLAPWTGRFFVDEFDAVCGSAGGIFDTAHGRHACSVFRASARCFTGSCCSRLTPPTRTQRPDAQKKFHMKFAFFTLDMAF